MKLLHAFILCMIILFTVGGSSGLDQPEDTLIYKKYKLDHTTPSPAVKPHEIAIFLHAAVGIFTVKRMKPGQTRDTWGYGREILEELLNTIKDANLLKKESVKVYITLLGNSSNIDLAEHTVRTFNQSGNVYIMTRGADLYVAELPTINAIHKYARDSDPRSYVLYMHTKGMRNNGDGSADWRRYMAYFLAERHELCLTVLKERNFDTCGVQLSNEEYEGNMWWATTEWLAGRPGIANFKWNMGNRYEAEDFLLRSRGRRSKSYCLFRIPHNLYDCPTPREIYANSSFALHPSPECFIPASTHMKLVPRSTGTKKGLCYTLRNE